MSEQLIGEVALLWLAAALLLGIAELLVPGFFLIFVAIAAGITGLLSWVLPSLPLWGQVLSLAGWTGVAVAVGRRWYADYPVPSADPLLNDRSARLIGETVEVCEAIEQGRGRVSVGDSSWSARGPDAPVGTRMRVVGAQAGVLVVEPVERSLAP